MLMFEAALLHSRSKEQAKISAVLIVVFGHVNCIKLADGAAVVEAD